MRKALTPPSSASSETSTPRLRFTKVLADGRERTYEYPRRSRAKAKRIENAAGTIGHLQALYYASPEWRDNLRPLTQKQYRTYLKYWEPLWDRPIEEVGRRQIITMRNHIAEENGGQAGNAFVQATGAWLKWLVDTAWLDSSPAWRIARIRGGEFPAWTDAQYQYAIEHLPEPLRRACYLARHTGQRRGDLVRMTWAQYDGAAITLRQQKSRELKQLVITLWPDVCAELNQWKRSANSIFILTGPSGTPWSAAHISIALCHAVRKLGLPDGLNLHGLRKLKAAHLADAGCSTHEIRAITGHQSLAEVERYTMSANQKELARSASQKELAAVVQLKPFIAKKTAGEE